MTNTQTPKTPRSTIEDIRDLIVAVETLTKSPTMTLTLSENGLPALSVFVDDPTGPNGQREFIIEAREV